MRERRENNTMWTAKGAQKGSEDKISNLLLITWYSFRKESHFLGLCNNNCYITLYLLWLLCINHVAIFFFRTIGMCFFFALTCFCVHCPASESCHHTYCDVALPADVSRCSRCDGSIVWSVTPATSSIAWWSLKERISGVWEQESSFIPVDGVRTLFSYLSWQRHATAAVMTTFWWRRQGTLKHVKGNKKLIPFCPIEN